MSAHLHLLALLGLVTSCASPSPVLRTAPQPTPDPKEEATSPALMLSVKETRTQGALLNFVLKQDVELATLELWRKLPLASSLSILQSIPITNARLQTLRQQGVDLLDPGAKPNQSTYQYQLRALDADGNLVMSNTLDVQTGQAYPPPKEITTQVIASQTALLTWKKTSTPGLGLLVFKRGIAPSSPTQRLVLLENAHVGAYLDREVEPGGIYAYRFVHFTQHDGFVRYGQLSPEIYATMPLPLSQEPEPIPTPTPPLP